MGEVELDEASIEVVRAYYDISARCKELEEQKESLNESIKELLKAKDAKRGRMPGFIAVLDLRSRSYLDNKLIPEEIREKATRESRFEVLSVRKLKSAGEAKSKRKEAIHHGD
jgi:predicted phage-related endonuclease